nr:RNA polymerase sigma factor [Membranihabitans maritimus]
MHTLKHSDEELIHAYLNTHDQKYFTGLYRRYSNKVYAKCLFLLKNEDLAEDATHDIFIKLLLNLSKFSNKARFSTWLYSITYNFCIDLLRKRKKINVVEIEDNLLNDESEEEDSISDAEILEMKIEQLERLMDQISDDEKIILLMKYQDDMSIKEIANHFDIGESAIKMRIKRSKERLRDLAEKDDQIYSHE